MVVHEEGSHEVGEGYSWARPPDAKYAAAGQAR